MPTTKKKDPHYTAGQSLLEFIDHSPTPFHAVAEIAKILEKHDFTRLDETASWDLSPGEKYYVSRNDTALVAFVLGSKPPETAGFKIIGAHTDSPNLRLKPNPAYDKNGYTQLGVEVYGGALLSTWTDRDLSLAGRVILRSQKSRLIKIDRPLLRIPQLAIHLNRNVNEKGLILNQQNHLPPILSLGKTKDAFLNLIAGEAKCRAGDILGMELSLFDVQPSTFAGLNQEFIFAPRLDNLASCHSATLALVQSTEKNPFTRVTVFYDNEEVGSESAQGGGSPFLKNILERIAQSSDKPREALMRAIARSTFISADMAHAVHPNYPEMHDSNHMPVINNGPVIKTNAGQRYATDGISSAYFETLCERAGVKSQKFVMRSDLACGSTIGPVTAANLGIRTVDVGNPMLSMHSAREMAGTRDHWDIIKVFKEFYWPEF
jgi:aspartyl aminopeptidase